MFRALPAQLKSSSRRGWWRRSSPGRGRLQRGDPRTRCTCGRGRGLGLRRRQGAGLSCELARWGRQPFGEMALLTAAALGDGARGRRHEAARPLPRDPLQAGAGRPAGRAADAGTLANRLENLNRDAPSSSAPSRPALRRQRRGPGAAEPHQAAPHAAHRPHRRRGDGGDSRPVEPHRLET